ncbi:MAG: hypothetical protein PHF57_05425, partial [Methanoregula sp.]|nr:hypothetical protein [Methanoregula sp.]
CVATLQDNYNGAASGYLWYASAGLPPTLNAPRNNYGFGAQIFSDGESRSLAHNASYIFARQVSSVYPIYHITNNNTRLANGIFTNDGTNLDLTNGLSTSIAYGDGADPATDDKVNIWIDTDGCINVKNYINATIVFSLSVR